jgi:RNA polymerase sigma-70 factor (ECF subfamily)
VSTDEELMVRVQAGDEGALAALMDRYQGPLYGFLNRRVGDAAADDLFQESWLRVVRARDRFDPRRRFSTWIFQIANNLCRDRGRRRAVEARHLESLAQSQRHEPARAAPPPVELRLDMRRRLDALPDRLREVLVLRYYQQLPERDIAEILGIPRGTVKSRLHAAVKALRAQEGDDGSD